MKILVTGGAGYIGSTVCSALIDAGHVPIIWDSLITGRREFTKGRIFYEGDIADAILAAKIMQEHPDIVCCIHFAALVVVADSLSDPYAYYNENVCKSLQLYRNLLKNGCDRVLFSSSAAIYDDSDNFVVTENSPLNPRSPYACTKYMMEKVLQDFTVAYDFSAIALRYFNPIGADPELRSGLHVKNPSHVLGKMTSVALGVEKEFLITGVEWPTRDGSGIRDYIHVWDLARAHVLAVEKFSDIVQQEGRYTVINIGSSNGVTVKEFLEAFERVWGKPINKRIDSPRPGDVAGAYADNSKAKKLLGWHTEKTIDQGISDGLAWANIRETIINYA